MTAGQGKTIEIFLPDGDPKGIRRVTLRGRTLHALLIPRKSLGLASKREELNNLGVYFLFGPSDEEPVELYIGQTENCKQRLRNHHQKKDFWTHAIVIVSNAQEFTIQHIRYLEAHCYELAQKNLKFKLNNSQIPSRPFTQESEEAFVFDAFESLRLLVSTLGFPVFEKDENWTETRQENENEIFYCTSKGAQASAKYTNGGMLALKGSTCGSEFITYVGIKRQGLIKSGILEQSDNALTFTQDYMFSSPSTSAQVISGRSGNGWIMWKNKEGKTLDQVYRQQDTPEA